MAESAPNLRRRDRHYPQVRSPDVLAGSDFQSSSKCIPWMSFFRTPMMGGTDVDFLSRWTVPIPWCQLRETQDLVDSGWTMHRRSVRMIHSFNRCGSEPEGVNIIGAVAITVSVQSARLSW